MTMEARVSISMHGAITVASTWMTCAAAAVYGSILLVGQCYWCAQSATAMVWYFRHFFTANAAGGCAHRTHGRVVTSARSKLRDSRPWRRTWVLNVGDYRILKSSIPNRWDASCHQHRPQFD